jgi:hypothetical protein
MPGKLKDDSASLRMVLLDDDRYLLRELIRVMGLNQTGVVRISIREAAARRGIKIPAPKIDEP